MTLSLIELTGKDHRTGLVDKGHRKLLLLLPIFVLVSLCSLCKLLYRLSICIREGHT